MRDGSRYKLYSTKPEKLLTDETDGENRCDKIWWASASFKLSTYGTLNAFFLTSIYIQMNEISSSKCILRRIHCTE